MSDTALERPTGRNVPRKYTAEQIDTCLLTLAITGGNYKAAAELLNQEGIEISDRHLARVKDSNISRYCELCAQHQQAIDDALKFKARDLALRASKVTEDAIDATETQIEAGEHKDPSTAARNLATVFGIYTDKYRVLDDKPNQITERRDATDLLKALQDKIPGLFTDSTAEEIPTSELTEHSAEGEIAR